VSSGRNDERYVPRADTTRGDPGDLVTTVFSGTVNAMGIVAGPVLTTDGVTAGGTWALIADVNIAPGANIAVTKLAPGAINTVLQTDGAGVVVWRNHLELPAAGYVQVGLPAGSGAGSAALTGGLRLQGNGAVQGRITFRNPADTGDYAGLSADNGTIVWLGGAFPTRPPYILADAATQVQLRVAGSAKLIVDATSILLTSGAPNLVFAADALLPEFYQILDPSAAALGDMLVAHAQSVDSAGAGASTGGAFVLYGGDGIDGDDHGGHIYLRGGRNVGAGTGTDANVALHVQVADAVNFQSGERVVFIGDAVTIPAAAAAAGSFLWSDSAVLTTTQLATVAAGYVRIGLVAGSGAGSAAGQGALRLQDDAGVVHRNPADTGDLSALWNDGVNTLWLGGTFGTAVRPSNIEIDAVSQVQVRRSGSIIIGFAAGLIAMNVATARFNAGVAAPMLSHGNLAAAASTGQLFTVHSQTVDSGGAGASTGGAMLLHGGDGTDADDHGGHTYVRGGRNVGAGAGTDANIGLHVQVTDAVNFQGGERIIYIQNAVTVPGGNAAGGGFLYVNAAALTYRGTGTTTVIAPAGPHCRHCGYDAWTVSSYSTVWKSWHFICGNCGCEYKGGPQSVLGRLDRAQKTELLHENMTWDQFATVLKAA